MAREAEVLTPVALTWLTKHRATIECGAFGFRVRVDHRGVAVVRKELATAIADATTVLTLKDQIDAMTKKVS